MLVQSWGSHAWGKSLPSGGTSVSVICWETHLPVVRTPTPGAWFTGDIVNRGFARQTQQVWPTHQLLSSKRGQICGNRLARGLRSLGACCLELRSLVVLSLADHYPVYGDCSCSKAALSRNGGPPQSWRSLLRT